MATWAREQAPPRLRPHGRASKPAATVVDTLGLYTAAALLSPSRSRQRLEQLSKRITAGSRPRARGLQRAGAGQGRGVLAVRQRAL